MYGQFQTVVDRLRQLRNYKRYCQIKKAEELQAKDEEIIAYKNFLKTMNTFYSALSRKYWNDDSSDPFLGEQVDFFANEIVKIQIQMGLLVTAREKCKKESDALNKEGFNVIEDLIKEENLDSLLEFVDDLLTVLSAASIKRHKVQNISNVFYKVSGAWDCVSSYRDREAKDYVYKILLAIFNTSMLFVASTTILSAITLGLSLIGLVYSISFYRQAKEELVAQKKLLVKNGEAAPENHPDNLYVRYINENANIQHGTLEKLQETFFKQEINLVFNVINFIAKGVILIGALTIAAKTMIWVLPTAILISAISPVVEIVDRRLSFVFTKWLSGTVSKISDYLFGEKAQLVLDDNKATSHQRMRVLFDDVHPVVGPTRQSSQDGVQNGFVPSSVPVAEHSASLFSGVWVGEECFGHAALRAARAVST